MAFYLTNKAKADLKDIARYTQRKWGIIQRNNYLTLLDDAFHDLEKWPAKGHNCSYIRSGYRKYRVDKHLIFYRTAEQTDIEIVRVLHEAMDIENYLKKE